MARPADVAEAAEDPRLLPRGYFVGVGGLVALALVLVRVHILFLLISSVGLIVGLLLALHRGAYIVDDRAKNEIALHSPLPGTMAPVMTAIALALLAASVIVGTVVPTSALPFWAVVVIACAVGTAVALLLRRSELLRMAGTRRLENRDG